MSREIRSGGEVIVEAVHIADRCFGEFLGIEIIQRSHTHYFTDTVSSLPKNFDPAVFAEEMNSLRAVSCQVIFTRKKAEGIRLDHRAPEPEFPAYFTITLESPGAEINPRFELHFSAVTAAVVGLSWHISILEGL